MGERKFLRTFICLTLMLSILLGTFGAQAAERTVTILELTNDFVYIRSSTGENSQIIGTLRKGTRMFYRGRSGSMAYVCTSNGTKGYVYAGYLEKVGEARIGNIYYVQSSSLAVYRSASTSSDSRICRAVWSIFRSPVERPRRLPRVIRHLITRATS